MEGSYWSRWLMTGLGVLAGLVLVLLFLTGYLIWYADVEVCLSTGPIERCYFGGEGNVSWP